MITKIATKRLTDRNKMKPVVLSNNCGKIYIYNRQNIDFDKLILKPNTEKSFIYNGKDIEIFDAFKSPFTCRSPRTFPCISFGATDEEIPACIAIKHSAEKQNEILYLEFMNDSLSPEELKYFIHYKIINQHVYVSELYDGTLRDIIDLIEYDDAKIEIFKHVYEGVNILYNHGLVYTDMKAAQIFFNVADDGIKINEMMSINIFIADLELSLFNQHHGCVRTYKFPKFLTTSTELTGVEQYMMWSMFYFLNELYDNNKQLKRFQERLTSMHFRITIDDLMLIGGKKPVMIAQSLLDMDVCSFHKIKNIL